MLIGTTSRPRTATSGAGSCALESVQRASGLSETRSAGLRAAGEGAGAPATRSRRPSPHWRAGACRSGAGPRDSAADASTRRGSRAARRSRRRRPTRARAAGCPGAARRRSRRPRRRTRTQETSPGTGRSSSQSLSLPESGARPGSGARHRPDSGSVGAGVTGDHAACGTRQDSLGDVRAHDQQARPPAEDTERVHSSRNCRFRLSGDRRLRPTPGARPRPRKERARGRTRTVRPPELGARCRARFGCSHTSLMLGPSAPIRRHPVAGRNRVIARHGEFDTTGPGGIRPRPPPAPRQASALYRGRMALRRRLEDLLP